MPSNWVHCVLTFGDSIALGSNCLPFGHMDLVIDSHVRNDDVDSVYPYLSGVLAALLYSHVMEQMNDRPGDVSSVWVWNFLTCFKTKSHQEMSIIEEVNQSVLFFSQALMKILTINYYFKACPHCDLEEVIMNLRKRRRVTGGFWSVAPSRVQLKVSTDTPTST